jgi:hypothetical protein
VKSITIDVWLYGPLTRYIQKKSNSGHANVRIVLPESSRVGDLLDRLGIPTEERGLTFINAKLTATPGVQPDLQTPLQDNDRVAFFHLKSMWPYQYRDGAQATTALSGLLKGGKRTHQL